MRRAQRRVGSRFALALVVAADLLVGGAAAGADELRVVATVPDLGDLVEQVGGDRVRVTTLVKGPQDPHFIEPRPSFVRLLHDADLYVQVGMDLEIGWAPVLLRSARNPDLLPGGRGHLDASAAIAPLEVPTAPFDRSMGDVHPYGNPHYLTDPVNGARVARLVRDKLIELQPEAADGFRAGYRAFARRLAGALVGEALAEVRDPDRLFALVEQGRLAVFLGERDQGELLGGWLGAVRSHEGRRAVQDHRMWAYYARRFGLELVATLEPQPGIAPTTRHLAQVVERMNAGGISLVLSSAYFDSRHARFVAERTGARILEMAHQVGAREGTGDYVATVDYNVRQLVGAP